MAKTVITCDCGAPAHGNAYGTPCDAQPLREPHPTSNTLRHAASQADALTIMTHHELSVAAARDSHGEAFLLTSEPDGTRSWHGAEEDGSLHCCHCHGCGDFCSWSTRRPAFPIEMILPADRGPIRRGRTLDSAQLVTVPVRTVVRAADGTIAGRVDEHRGVVLGDERPFPWTTLNAPALVLWSESDEDESTGATR